MTIQLNKDGGWKICVQHNEDDSPLERDWKLCIEKLPAAEYMSHQMACKMRLTVGPNPHLVHALIEMVCDRGYTHDELLTCDIEEVREIAKAVADTVGFIQGRASEWDDTKTDQIAIQRTKKEEDQ